MTARPRWATLWISKHPHDQVAALREMPDKALRHAILKRMLAADASVKVLVAFLEQIGRRALKSMLPQARDLAGHEDGRVRRSAMVALMACDPAEADEASLKGLRSSFADQRTEALDFIYEHQLLGVWGSDAPEILLLALSDEDAAVAQHAGLWLKKMAHSDMLGWLELQLRYASETVVWRIAVVAADLGSQKALDHLLGPAGDLCHPGSETCALALARRRDALSAQWLIRHWPEIHPAWHPHLCRVLGSQKNDPQTLLFLLSLIEKCASGGDRFLLPEIHPYEVFFGCPLELDCEAGMHNEGTLGRLLRLPLRRFVLDVGGATRNWPDRIDTRQLAHYYPELDEMMSTVLLTGLAAARAFAGWTGVDAMHGLLRLRLRGSGNVARIAGYAVAAGGPWEGPFSANILDHLALRGFRGGRLGGRLVVMSPSRSFEC